MDVAAYAVEHHGALDGGVEFGTAEIRRRAPGVLPDPEHFVDGVERVDFELIVSVLAGDEDLDVVLFPDRNRARSGSPTSVSSTQKPKYRCRHPIAARRAFEPGRLASDDIDEGRGSGRRQPGRLIELAIHWIGPAAR